MYKVFFNDKTVFFSDDFSKVKNTDVGLIYKFNSSKELRHILDLFITKSHIQRLHLFHEDLSVLKKEFEACFKLIHAGGGLVFNRKGEFLAIKRNGVWDLPKGKLENGEDFKAAALREVKEETGLKKLIALQPLISTYHIYQNSSKKVLKKTQWFEMQYPGKKEPVLEEKEGITKHRWVKPGKSGFIKKNTYRSIMDVLSIRDLL